VIIGGGSTPDLHGISVRVPPEGVHLYDKVAYYEVIVTAGAPSTSWRVLRRYNHFKDLSRAKDIASDAPFPPKLWLSPGNSQIQDRRQALARWLVSAVEKAALKATRGDAWAPEMLKFLLLGRSPVQVNAEKQKEALSQKLNKVSTQSFGPPSFEPPEASAPQAEADGFDGLVLLHVEIPKTLGPDDLMQVKAPDDKIIVISIPWGLAPEVPLALWWDPVAGTLGVHHRQDWQALRGDQ